MALIVIIIDSVLLALAILLDLTGLAIVLSGIWFVAAIGLYRRPTERTPNDEAVVRRVRRSGKRIRPDRTIKTDFGDYKVYHTFDNSKK